MQRCCAVWSVEKGLRCCGLTGGFAWKDRRLRCRWMSNDDSPGGDRRCGWVEEFVVSHTLDWEILWGIPADRQRKRLEAWLSLNRGDSRHTRSAHSQSSGDDISCLRHAEDIVFHLWVVGGGRSVREVKVDMGNPDGHPRQEGSRPYANRLLYHLATRYLGVTTTTRIHCPDIFS